jgi:hypothetical protein
MFICLSSGASPRYLEDILRSLALPAGAVVQFRYDKKRLAQAARMAIDRAQTEGQPALIAYIDQRTQGQPPTYVPCRFATIKKVSEHGTTVGLELLVADYAYSENLAGFNQWMGATFAADLPTWTGNTIGGKYWLRSTHDPASVSRTTSLGDWEKITEQLASHEDFDEEDCFYTVIGLRRPGKKTVIIPAEGTYALGGGTGYELVIYHYHPSKRPTDLLLEFKLAGGGLEFTTNPVMRIDSRYDQKLVRFQTASGPAKKIAFLTLVRGKEGEELMDWQFDLPVITKGQLVWTGLYAIAVAILLAGPQLYSTWSNPNLPHDNAVNTTAVSVVFSLLAGVFAAFVLKKPW